MRRSFFAAGILAGALTMSGFFCCHSALAEVIQGEITGINPENKTVTLQPTNQQNLPRELQIKMKDDVFQNNHNVQSLNDLTVGDQITVEADKSFFGRKWNAQSLISVQNTAGAQSTSTQGSASAMSGPASSGAIAQPAASGSTPQPGLSNTAEQTPLESESVIYGKLVSADPKTGKIVVSEYSTGQEKSFTVVDTNTLNSVKPGEQVMLKADSSAPSAARPADRTDAAGRLNASRDSSPGESLPKKTPPAERAQAETNAGEMTSSDTGMHSSDISAGGLPTAERSATPLSPVGSTGTDAAKPDMGPASLKAAQSDLSSSQVSNPQDSRMQTDEASGIVSTSNP